MKPQGSNRVYTRETDESGRTVIRVEGTNRDENRAFIYMARHFHALGLPVPEVYQVSEDEMTYTQEDLGDTLLFDAIRHGRETGCFLPEERTLLERAIRALAHIQVEGAQNFNWNYCFPVPAFDERSVRWDLNYFKYCFLKGTKIEFSEPKLEDDFDRLVANLTAQRSNSETVLQRSGLTAQRSFMYRDCQSRNIMIKDGQPYFIDFQGGRRGPTQYDVASLLWQAKANIPASLREELIDAYLDELEKLQITNARYDTKCILNVNGKKHTMAKNIDYSAFTDTIRESVSALQVGIDYGLNPGRDGRCPCIFCSGARDDTLKLYGHNRGFYCYRCHQSRIRRREQDDCGHFRQPQ